jgi:predicted DNA-binding protein (UPF0251 family)
LVYPNKHYTFIKIFFMVTEMTQTAYAKKMGVSKMAISKRIKKGSALPGVLHIKWFGRISILTFDNHTNMKAAKKTFKKVVK